MFKICVAKLSLNSLSFIFSRKETKSSYDMLRISGDMTEYTSLGNSMYRFVLSYVPTELNIRIPSSANFLRHYYYIPLQYSREKGFEWEAINIPFENRVFDNDLFTVSVYDRSVFLNEKEPLRPR